jgi:UDP-N-acetylmuramyl pentapeptide synthase
LNADDDFTPRIAAACPQRVLRAGFAADADIRVVALEAMGRAELHFPDRSHISFTLPVPGKHMLGNASLAAAAGWHFGLRPEQIAQGLESAQLTGGRLQRRTIAGLHFLDDSYNANLDSMLRGLETLRSFSPEGRRVAVLGRMAELGAHSEDFHRQVGQAAAHPEIALLCTVGEDDSRHLATSAEALGQTVLRFPNHAQCADYLKNTLSPKDLILLKGSHSAAMYEVINLLSAPSVPTPL